MRNTALGVMVFVGIGAAALITNNLLNTASKFDGHDAEHEFHAAVAAEHAKESPATSSKMACGDESVIQVAKELINDQFPSVNALGNMLSSIEAERSKSELTPVQQQEKNIREAMEFFTKNQDPIINPQRYKGNPVAERAQRLAEMQAELNRRKMNEQNEKARKAAAPPPQPIAKNEVILIGQPRSTQYDRDLDIVSCAVTFKIAGPAYDTINAIQGANHSGVYTVQPGKDEWIITLLNVQ